MTRRFFYNSHQLTPLSQYSIGERVPLTEEVHHHWCRVLRSSVGDTATLFDGLGGEYDVELLEISKSNSTMKLLSFTDIDNTPMMTTQIGLVMSRGERMDYAIQKATEMGVTSIQLLTSHHGEVRLKPVQVAKKLNHWQQVAISACEQCGMNRVPLIVAPLAITDWFKQMDINAIQENSPNFTGLLENVCEYMHSIATTAFYKKIIHYEDSADLSLVLTVPNQGESPIPIELPQLITNKHSENIDDHSAPFFRVLIGSEGGLSVDEINESRQIGFQPWQIGDRVLRTETAPVVALATLQAFITAKSIF